MASEEELGLTLRSSSMDVVADFCSEGWSGLPPELLEMIGSKFTEGAHLSNAAMVCKSWNASIATGLTSLEVDMHSDPLMWRAKIAKLQSLIRHLSCVVIHVNAAISDEMLFQNISLVQQLGGVKELKLHLREGCDLPPAAAAAIGSLRHLTSLSITGGGLKADAAAGLLTGLAAAAAEAAASGGSAAAGGLRALTLLPSVPYGLGDVEMALLAACFSLEVLKFRSYRLTSAGLATLSLGLPRLTRLAITSLDSDSGYELACLERLQQLAELDLALDNAPTGAASRRALCAVRPGRSLSLSFRWTDKAQGLLAEYGNRLANLTHLDVGACRVGSESLFEAVAQLTGLRELRMSMYSNSDHCIPCHLSRLSALAALQRFHLEKRKAYFPEARRFGESSIAVPVTAEGLRSLAGRWCRLKSLRLALNRKDYSPEALSVLSSFTGLRELGIVVERHQPGTSSSSSSGTQTQETTQRTNHHNHHHHNHQQQQQQQEDAASQEQSGPGLMAAGSATQSSGGGALGGGGGGGSAARLSMPRRAVELPPLLDMACLPPGLHSLELNNLLLDLSEPPAAAAAPAAIVMGAMPAAAPTELVSPGVTTRGLSLSLGLGLGSSPHTAAAASVFDAHADNTLMAFTLPGVDGAGGSASTAASVVPPPPPLPLSQLTSLDVESCVVRSPLLARAAARCGGSLRCLRLVGVVGLSDAVLADCLPALPMLRSLTVSAPGNRAVSQAALAALSCTAATPPPPSSPPAGGGHTAAGVNINSSSNAATAGDSAATASGLLRSWRLGAQRLPKLLLLRQLSWESDDLTALGPDLHALAPLTSLRHLYLSCTDKTAERALGSLRGLQDALPYCHVDMVWTAPRPGDAA